MNDACAPVTAATGTVSDTAGIASYAAVIIS